MKAIIMAAGVGSRISRNIDKPKCLLGIEGQTILRKTIKMLQKNHIEVAVVVGYLHQQLRDEIADLNVAIYHNPFFRVTNSLGSLWFAKEFIPKNEDLLLINADVFWEQDILDVLLKDDKEALLLADSSHIRILEGDYFFGCKDDKIVKYGKDLAKEIRTHEYVGVCKIKPAFAKRFQDMMTKLIEEEHYNYWWEDILYQCSATEDIYVRDVSEYFWAEVDYIEDYERIIEYLRQKAEIKVCNY